MCPDKSILSAWFDGEVDGLWGDRISEHLKSCHSCSAFVHQMQDQQNLLHSLPEPDFTDSLDRVKFMIREKRTVSRTTRFWERRIPVPVAAAAAIVAATFSLSINVLAGNRNDGLNAGLASAGGNYASVINLPGDKVDEFFRMMEVSMSDEFSSNSIMELPSDVSLSFNGDSQLVKSVGYKGSASP
ncbi:MAG: zf-HC2 domain-containing protein [Spirochaetales bacterium]|nr:zf-HC2 domain-containing protein [Spirochaetales bacterium]